MMLEGNENHVRVVGVCRMVPPLVRHQCVAAVRPEEIANSNVSSAICLQVANAIKGSLSRRLLTPARACCYVTGFCT